MDFLAGILELFALYIIGSKNKFGFLLNIIVASCWIIHVYLSKESYGLLLVVIPAIFINLRNYVNWQKI